MKVVQQTVDHPDLLKKTKSFAKYIISCKKNAETQVLERFVDEPKPRRRRQKSWDAFHHGLRAFFVSDY
jgi:hypothetical protein